MPPALNRKSISRLLTAAGREKLLISAADLCKSRICLRSTCLFDLCELFHCCCCLLLNPDVVTFLAGEFSQQPSVSISRQHAWKIRPGRPGWLPIANEVAANRQRGQCRSPARSAPVIVIYLSIVGEISADRLRGHRRSCAVIVICRSLGRSSADRWRGLRRSLGRSGTVVQQWLTSTIALRRCGNSHLSIVGEVYGDAVIVICRSFTRSAPIVGEVGADRLYAYH
jgi:hypothetical protein